MTGRHRAETTHTRRRGPEPEATATVVRVQNPDTTLKGISSKLANIENQLNDIYITGEVKALKAQVNEIQKDLKKYKKYEGQLKDLNRELHEFTKWRYAVEDKIGAVEV